MVSRSRNTWVLFFLLSTVLLSTGCTERTESPTKTTSAEAAPAEETEYVEEAVDEGHTTNGDEEFPGGGELGNAGAAVEDQDNERLMHRAAQLRAEVQARIQRTEPPAELGSLYRSAEEAFAANDGERANRIYETLLYELSLTLRRQATPGSGQTATRSNEAVARRSPPPPPPPPPPTANMQPPAPEMPMFPWPPPQASSLWDLPSNLFSDAELLHDVDTQLSAALEAAGYVEKQYFAVPGGFALVSRLEQIEADGSPKPGAERWSLDVGRLQEFSLTEYFRALFTSSPGFFRVIVFVVTPYPFTQADESVSRDEAVGWLSSGVNRLSSEVAQREFSPEFTSTALVYEFEKLTSADAEPTMPTPGRLTARTHLERATILQNLESPE